jgi:hypothetical protein
MTEKKQDWSSTLVKVQRDLITKGPSLLAKRALDDFIRIRAQPPSGPIRMTFHVLYADWGLQNIFHDRFVQPALGAKYHILPVWSSHEQEIRLLWSQKQFHCAFLVLNNIVVPHWRNPDERIAAILSLISWMREQSSATIIALSGWKPSAFEEKAIRNGADRFFPLPFPAQELWKFLIERFGIR